LKLEELSTKLAEKIIFFCFERDVLFRMFIFIISFIFLLFVSFIAIFTFSYLNFIVIIFGLILFVYLLLTITELYNDYRNKIFEELYQRENAFLKSIESDIMILLEGGEQ